MTRTTTRRIWFVGLWLLMPWPMIVFAGQSVPAVRYLLLALVAIALAIQEGAAGPVLGIVGLLTGWTLATTLACWVLAWGISHFLERLPGRLARPFTWACLAIALAIALFASPYVTKFGRAPTGGLLAILS